MGEIYFKAAKEVLGVDKLAIMGSDRRYEFIAARMIIVNEMKTAGYTYQQIGSTINRGAWMANYYSKKFKDEMDTNKLFAQSVKDVRLKLIEYEQKIKLL